jgi:hypothetical protein
MLIRELIPELTVDVVRHIFWEALPAGPSI